MQFFRFLLFEIIANSFGHLQKLLNDKKSSSDFHFHKHKNQILRSKTIRICEIFMQMIKNLIYAFVSIILLG